MSRLARRYRDLSGDHGSSFLVPTLLLLLPLLAVQRGVAQEQQGGPFKVLIPALAAHGDASAKFGEQVADRLRRLMASLATHEAVSPHDIRADLRRFDLHESDLTDCVKTQQLAAQLHFPLVMCGWYEAREDGMEVAARVVSPGSGDSYEIEPFRAADPAGAAAHIMDDFRRYLDQIKYARYCHDYAQSRNWADAMENCDRAVAINPRSASLQYQRARLLMDMDSLPQAADGLRRVLALNPVHQDGLLSLAIVTAKLGQKDESLGYFRQYLQLNPGDDEVRLRIATDAANAGNNEAALALVEEGMRPDSVDAVLLEYAGHFATNAAQQRLQENDSTAATALLEKALTYYQRVCAVPGRTPSGLVYRNQMVDFRLLGRTAAAVQAGADAVAAMPDSASLWSIYADVLQDAGRLEEALAALDRATALDSTTARVNARKGTWLVQAGQLESARPFLRAAVAQQELENADLLARNIFATGYNGFGKQEKFAEAVPYYVLAREFATDPQTAAMIDFFHGYAILRQAIVAQEPRTLATARATLPLFQEARKLIDGAAAYRAQAASRLKLLEQIDVFIEIQQGLIKRG